MIYLSAYQDCTHFFFHCSTILMGRGLLICEASCSHSMTHAYTRARTHTHTQYDPSGRVISPSQSPYLTTHTTHNRDIQAPGGIGTPNPSKRTVADLRLIPRGHRDGHYIPIAWFNGPFFFNLARQPPSGPGPPHSRGF